MLNVYSVLQFFKVNCRKYLHKYYKGDLEDQLFVIGLLAKDIAIFFAKDNMPKINKELHMDIKM